MPNIKGKQMLLLGKDRWLHTFSANWPVSPQFQFPWVGALVHRPFICQICSVVQNKADSNRKNMTKLKKRQKNQKKKKKGRQKGEQLEFCKSYSVAIENLFLINPLLPLPIFCISSTAFCPSSPAFRPSSNNGSSPFYYPPSPTPPPLSSSCPTPLHQPPPFFKWYIKSTQVG